MVSYVWITSRKQVDIKSWVTFRNILIGCYYEFACEGNKKTQDLFVNIPKRLYVLQSVTQLFLIELSFF